MWPMTLFGWLSNGVNLAVAILAVATTLSAATAFKRLWIDKSGATRDDVKDDGRKTREGVEHLSRQSVAETNVLLSEIETLKQLLLAQNPANAQQIESFATTAIDLAESDSATDQSIAREAVEGDPLAASDRLMAEVAVGVAEQAQRARQAARIAAPFSVAKAITAYARAVELDPTHFNTWIELSRLHEMAGSLPEARRTAEAALQHVGGDWDRMVAENTLGDIAVADGNLLAAQAHYQAGLLAAQAVLVADPDDNNRQREVSVSHNKLGDVARAGGKLSQARDSYAASLAISERLAAADPSNVVWQRDLSVDYGKLGEVEHKEGHLEAARTALTASCAIGELLAVSDPDNTELQYNLAMIRERLGDVALAEGAIRTAREDFNQRFKIIERLAKSNLSNAMLQRERCISHDRLARVAKASGDMAGAIREFEAGEAILVALIARVGDHPGFARDLAQVRGELARLRGA